MRDSDNVKNMPVQENVDKMMRSRGYDLTSRTDTNSVLIYTKSGGHHTIMIWFYNNEKLNIDAMKDFIVLLDQHQITNGIIIYSNNVTSSCKKIMEQMYKYSIELFSASEFMYVLTDHMYYCPHRKLTDTETAEITRSFGNKLPILLRADPVVRYFNFNKNDIIEIRRKNSSFAYRIVK
jgi:hypothetical protein